MAASIAFFSYLMALTVELRIKLKNSTVVNYKKRNRFYHVYAVVVSGLFCVAGVLGEQFGVSDMKTCSFQDGKPARYVYSSFLFVNILVIWLILFSIRKELRSNVSSLMFNYVMVIVSVSLTICVAQVMEIIEHVNKHKGDFRMVGIIFGSLTGTCIALSRLINKSLLTRLYFRAMYSSKRQVTDTMLSLISLDNIYSEEITFLSEYFDSITKKVRKTQVIHQILAMLYMNLEEPQPHTNILLGNIRFTDYKFQSDFIESIPDLEKIKQEKGEDYIDSLKNKVLREYMPLEFKKIRELCGVSNKDLQKYEILSSIILHIKNFNIDKMEGGSSSAFIFTTVDEKFVIKTINSSERKLFLRILPKYTERIFGCGESRLIRILGLFKLIPENQDFIIMENIVPGKENALLFDLKGSLIDRRVSTSTETKLGKVLKDKNFYEEDLKIEIDSDKAGRLIKVLEEDFEILRAENIMDYSILLAFYHKVPEQFNRYFIVGSQGCYSLGVIDILQEYNFSKISEEKLKKIYKQNTSMLSVAEPSIYYQRIIDFLTQLFPTYK